MNKAEFRALRERLGVPKDVLADLLQVTTHTVSRWEREDSNDPPAKAQKCLENIVCEHDLVVQFGINKAHEAYEQTGSKEVVLPYYYDQEMYNRHAGATGECYSMVNSRTIDIKQTLDKEGYSVHLYYSE